MYHCTNEDAVSLTTAIRASKSIYSQIKQDQEDFNDQLIIISLIFAFSLCLFPMTSGDPPFK